METDTSNSIHDLAELDTQDVAAAGHKGSVLGALEQTGLPIPDAFVVEARECTSFFEATGLHDRIMDRLSDLDVHDLVELENASVHIRGEIVNAEIPDRIQDAITTAYRNLGSPLVAVRSSPISEHTPEVSFAGMNETQLHVLGEVAVIRSIKHCWSSLFTARNIRYSRTHGRSSLATGIAAIVQKQIDPVKAGTLITVNPVTGNPDQMLIEASFGLGESVTGGSVSPDRFVLDRTENTVLASEVPHKEYVVEKEPGEGTGIHHIADEQQDRPVLVDLEMSLLVGLGLQVEEILGGPQSIEWAMDHDHVTWIIQARPAPDSTRFQQVDVDDNLAGETIIHGECAMPGTVMGKVRVVTSEREAADFKVGEILVTRDLLPEWTPLMQTAAAVVTDYGGLTSHAATVARELEIPCVVGTKAATTALGSGQTVKVDATSGTVGPA